MKLRNKKTGEIVKFETTIYADTEDRTYEFNSIAELNEEWEDCEEPNIRWYIYGASPLEVDDENWNEEFINELKDTGNYFETKEETEKAIEKLKAWKRLKDAGVSFKPTTIGHKWYLEPHASPENRTFKESQDLYKDVMIFFGGEDDKK